VSELEKRVVDRLSQAHGKQFQAQLKGGKRNLEQALSRIRRIASLLENGSEKVDGLTSAMAKKLDGAICAAIARELDVKDADLDPMRSFAAWAAGANYHGPLEVFTVNYDLLLETALEDAGVPYFDGFVGALRAGFRTDLVEAQSGGDFALPAGFMRLWKLHGSLHWSWKASEGGEIVRVGAAIEKGAAAAIYPSDAKYEESRRVPFVVLHDRLRRALADPETLVLTSGYSFSDQDLNEMLFEAATRRPRSEVIAFCHSAIPAVLATQAESTPNLQAVTASEGIIGGVRAGWTKPDDPPPGIWDGGFALADFAQLAAYLARSTSPEESVAGRIAATEKKSDGGQT
jgi:SIR2-like domain